MGVRLGPTFVRMDLGRSAWNLVSLMNCGQIARRNIVRSNVIIKTGITKDYRSDVTSNFAVVSRILSNPLEPAAWTLMRRLVGIVTDAALTSVPSSRCCVYAELNVRREENSARASHVRTINAGAVSTNLEFFSKRRRGVRVARET